MAAPVGLTYNGYLNLEMGAQKISMKIMPKKKCPACGATDTIKILYDEPTYESCEAAERGEIALGGCLISEVSPKRYCKACGEDFG
ncbi:hypothetical protein [Clostridium saccharoperbutylacetonicum]|uniref:hypothetical protein n=1 Tax=Clostridium saccharoperbutylacetonicum TaxID=36745 RepID=UPI0039ECABFB